MKVKRVFFLLSLCYFFPMYGNVEVDPYSISENEDPLTKQSKLLISNDYRELMTVYDPIWLAHLWPKLSNGVHLKMEKNCWKNLTTFFQDMLDGHAWALGAVDSSGSFSAGLLWGNRYWIGSQDECNDLNKRYVDFVTNSSSSTLAHLNYISSLNRNVENTGSKQSRRDSLNPLLLSKMILLDNTPPYEMTFSAVKVCLNITKTTLYSSHIVSMGICLPQICQEEDIHELLDFSIKTYQNLRVSGTLPRTAKILKVRTLNKHFDFLHNTKFLMLCVVVLFTIILTIVGTLIDITLKESEFNIREAQPTFKSFIQSNAEDSLDQSLQIKTNDIKITNENQAEVHISQMTEQKSLESFHTVDGLIPNKYTEIVSDFQFLENTINLKNGTKNKINLVTVKNITKTDNTPIVMLDIVTTKIKDDANTKEFEKFHKKTKYNLSNEDDVSTFRSISCISRETFLVKLILCFSLKANLHKIFSMDIGEDTLAPIHGMKFITILWVILVHTTLVIYHLSDNKVYRGIAESNFFYQIIGNGTFSVDTFFVLSGLLISYLYYQTIKRCTTTNAIDVSGFMGKSIQLITAITYRYIRLTPPYLFSIVILLYVSIYFNSHNILELPGNDDENCKMYWWRNILYINTFYPLNETCMSWSWYLAIDTQFYIVGIFLLIISLKHFKIAATFFIGFLLVGWITTAMVTLKTGHIPSIEDPFSHYDELYNKPWTRISPYLIGLFTGWILSRTSCCLLISKKVSIVLWFISILLLFGVIFGLQKITFDTYSSIAYTTLSHTSWGMAISWIIIACVTGYGGFINEILSCRYIYPLSRLTYCAYLMHPILLKVIFISSGSIQHISPEIVGVFYIGFIFVTFVIALIFSLLFEAPAVSMLRLIHPMKKSLC